MVKGCSAAASGSVLAVGGSGGLMITLWVMADQLDQAKSEVTYGETLSGISFAVMAIMLGLIFGGLLWCFYRALKAAGREAPVQEPEGME